MMKVLCGQTIAMPARMAQAIATAARRIASAIAATRGGVCEA